MLVLLAQIADIIWVFGVDVAVALFAGALHRLFPVEIVECFLNFFR